MTLSRPAASSRASQEGTGLPRHATGDMPDHRQPVGSGRGQQVMIAETRLVDGRVRRLPGASPLA